MAVYEFHFHSGELKMNTDAVVIGPDAPMRQQSLADWKVLYLLHGLSDDCGAWLRHTRIEDYALKHHIMVIMPSGGRSMYCDHVNGQNYLGYLANELPAYLRGVLNHPLKPEQSYIAGNSMGGLGAAKIALTYPERYRGFASFSGLLAFGPFMQGKEISRGMMQEFAFMQDIIDHPTTTSLDPINLLNERQIHPDFYLACGLEDDLLGCTEAFYHKARQLGMKGECVLEAGKHDWDFWERTIARYTEVIHEGK